VFVGIRPLVGAGSGNTAALSRDHTLQVSRSGLVTIAGGKWTTYRHMAEDVIDQAATLAGLEHTSCRTRDLRLHGYVQEWESLGHLWPYGSDAERIRDLARDRPELADRLHPGLPIIGAQVVWAVRHEMARTVDDVLSRRTRSLLFDALAAAEAAPKAAELMAAELGRDAGWVDAQVAAFGALAAGYRIDGPATSS
jgi:glycerol-3-phosphate dehydrogenase